MLPLGKTGDGDWEGHEEGFRCPSNILFLDLHHGNYMCSAHFVTVH